MGSPVSTQAEKCEYRDYQIDTLFLKIAQELQVILVQERQNYFNWCFENDCLVDNFEIDSLTPIEVLLNTQLSTLRKKYSSVEGTLVENDKAALAKFILMQELVNVQNSVLNTYINRRDRRNLNIQKLTNHARLYYKYQLNYVESPCHKHDWMEYEHQDLLPTAQFIAWQRTASFESYFTLHHCLLFGRNGPGASLGTSGTGFFPKTGVGGLACTSKLYNLLTKPINSYLLDMCDLKRSLQISEIVDHAQLAFVPKTDKISRLISIEPAISMWFQLGAAHILQAVLKYSYGIVYSQTFGPDWIMQPDKNKTMARLGSLHGNYATFDLTSASDSISISLVKYLLPKWLFDFLFNLRTDNLLDCENNVTISYGCFSLMGNGFTFPLQTLIFSILVETAFRSYNASAQKGEQVKFKRPTRCNTGSFGVFGDDIIVPELIAPVLYSLLLSLGFTVNREKSFSRTVFNSIPFRESCGGDYYKGLDVRPFYIKRLNSTADWYTAYNVLSNWSFKHGLQLPSATNFILKQIKKNEKLKIVPPTESAPAGIILPDLSVLDSRDFSRYNLSVSFDVDLQVFSFRYKAYRPRIRTRTLEDIYKLLSELKDLYQDEEDVIKLRKDLSRFLGFKVLPAGSIATFNLASLFAFLERSLLNCGTSGNIFQGHLFMTRQLVTKYNDSEQKTTMWCPINPSKLEFFGDGPNSKEFGLDKVETLSNFVEWTQVAEVKRIMCLGARPYPCGKFAEVTSLTRRDYSFAYSMQVKHSLI